MGRPSMAPVKKLNTHHKTLRSSIKTYLPEASSRAATRHSSRRASLIQTQQHPDETTKLSFVEAIPCLAPAFVST
jgi:hypothetical protein